MTSDLLSRRIEVARFGMIYAASQKNLGPAGVVVAIIRRDLIERARRDIPIDLALRHPRPARLALLHPADVRGRDDAPRPRARRGDRRGRRSRRQNREKARRLYAALERRPELYSLPAEAGSRSIMQRDVPPADAGRRRAVPRRGRAPRHGRAQGPPLGRRDPRLHLQLGLAATLWTRSPT